MYRGQLLEGWYQIWCICERERLQHVYLIMLDKPMRYCEVQGDLEAGIAYGFQISRCDRAREYTHRQLMRLLYLAGDRSGALSQFECCGVALREELGVEPTQRTKKLHQQIQQDKVDLSFPDQTRREFIEGADQALFQYIVAEMEQIQADLASLNRRGSRASDLVNILILPDADDKIAA